MSDDLPTRRIDLGDQPIADLEIWDLVSAFGRIMREAGGPPATEVIYDDTPIYIYMQRIHTRLHDVERLHLMDLVEGGIHKSSLIGWFLATLELTRHHGAAVEQDEHGDRDQRDQETAHWCRVNGSGGCMSSRGRGE